MRKVNQLKSGAILSYISLVLSNVISIVYTPIMIRVLGQSEYGLFNLSNSIIGYLGLFNFGLGNAIVKYTAKYRAIGDKEGQYKLSGLFFIIYSIIAVIILLAGGVLILNIDSIYSNTLTITELNKMRILMTLMIFNMAISFPFSIFSGLINAHERFIFPKVMDILRAILNPFIMLPLLLMGYKSITMTIASTILNLGFIALNVYYCFKILKVKLIFKNQDLSILREIIGYSFFIFINMIVDKIYWSTDQLILGAVSGTVSVAIYTVGSTFNSYYMSFSTAISDVFLPKITTMVTTSSNDKQLSDLFIRTGRIQFIVISCILTSFILIGKEFINLWAGKDYAEAYYIALVVMIPLTIPLIQNIGISILQAKNMHRFRSKVYILIAIINLIMSIPMAKLYGGFGAALCTGISLIIGNVIVMNIYYYKKVRIDIICFWKEIFKMIIPVIFSVFIGGIIIKYINISGYIGILIKGSTIMIIFSVIMWNWGMNYYEKQLFGQPFKILLNKFKVKILRGSSI